MSKIAMATAVVTLAAAALAAGHAEAQPAAHFVPPPGAAPPWADAATTTEDAPASAPTATPSPTPAALPAPADTQQPGGTVPIAVGTTPMQGTTTPIHAVSLRAGPNRDAPVIGTLHPGDQLDILATANYGWTEVRSPAGTGWAYGSYLASGINPLARMSGNTVPPSTGAGADER